MSTKATHRIRIGILGASGYTGADLVRLLGTHEAADIRVVTANAHAGKSMAEVYPHLGGMDLPRLQKVEEANWDDLDVVFCGLPHGTTQKIIASLPAHVKVVDLSADFRLRNVETYAEWYGHEHFAPQLQPGAVYGLTEHYRDQIKDARLVACPGCYPTAVLMLLLPLVGGGLIEPTILSSMPSPASPGQGGLLRSRTSIPKWPTVCTPTASPPTATRRKSNRSFLSPLAATCWSISRRTSCP